jgi:hypothetical protein
MNYSDYFKLLDTDYNGTISFKDLLRVILPVCSSEVQAGFLQQGSVDVSQFTTIRKSVAKLASANGGDSNSPIPISALQESLMSSATNVESM